MSFTNCPLKIHTSVRIDSGFSLKGANEVSTFTSQEVSRLMFISLGTASERSMSLIEISNIFAILFEISSIGAVIAFTASSKNSISNSRFTYVVTLIAEIAEYENAGGCISIKSVGR